MKIAFVGKGGSGKTTLTSLVAKTLLAQGKQVFVIDADINQHLGKGLGIPEEILSNQLRVGMYLEEAKDFFAHQNPLLSDRSEMIRTTPPGKGSRLIRPFEENAFFHRFAIDHEGLRFISTGEFSDEDLGVKCYHGKIGGAELLLNHLVDSRDEVVLVDMTAGADAFSTGMFLKFDLTFMVTEPAEKSVGVFTQYAGYAEPFGVTIEIIANKVADTHDLNFIERTSGRTPIATLPYSQFVRATERGEKHPIDQLEQETIHAIEKILKRVHGTKKDWEKFYRDTVMIHKKTAMSRPESTEALLRQIDAHFDITQHLPE